MIKSLDLVKNSQVLVAASLHRKKVDGAAIVFILVPQHTNDQLRCRSRCQRQYGFGVARIVARGAPSIQSSLGQLHLRGQQCHSWTRNGTYIQWRQSCGNAAQPRKLAISHRLFCSTDTQYCPKIGISTHLSLRWQLKWTSCCLLNFKFCLRSENFEISFVEIRYFCI